MQPAEYFTKHFSGKKICILGLGREGNSTLQAFFRYLPDANLVIADQDESLKTSLKNRLGELPNIEFRCGKGYMDAINECAIVFKSPGLSYLQLLPHNTEKTLITSQTAVLLDIFREQITGITGTKGKSTTASLLYNIYKIAGRDALLAGNIGIPAFDILDDIKPHTRVVCELSSHQLEKVSNSPHIAIILNIFQEHLDHYASYEDYQLAKMQIAMHQKSTDYLIYDQQNDLLHKLVSRLPDKAKKIPMGNSAYKYSGAWRNDGHLWVKVKNQLHHVSEGCAQRKIPGQHNLKNILAASAAAFLDGIAADDIAKGIATFEGLKHRLEFIAEKNGVKYYNDSISTIPEATIEALKTFENVHTLILGGHDRGVDYQPLITYLVKYPVEDIIFLGKAGERMLNALKAMAGNELIRCTKASGFEDAVLFALKRTQPGGICLLSPAASSYDAFKNFEERGEKFRQIIFETKNNLPEI